MKRFFDIFFTLFGLLILIPLAFLIALLILIKIGSPVFFVQVRPGKDCKPFKILKFRTMTSERDEYGTLLPNAQRMTKFGNFLRHTSLDEIPEFYNVLKGEMSLVGPRPLLMDYVPLFNHLQNKRHNVRPGITGWAQVNGRNAISWDDKFKYDVWYVENQGFFLDLKIIWMTIIKVFKREGITNKDDVAMPRFAGNNDFSKQNDINK
jgi:sugar transferase EpsL